MLELKVTVEIPGLPESINNLAAALGGVKTNNILPFPAASPAPIAATPATTPTPVQAAAVPAPAPVAPPVAAPAPVAPPIPTPSPAPVPAPQKAVTMEEVARAGAELVDQNKMGELIALLGTFGVASITQLKPEMLPDFAVKIRALGANI